MTSPEQIVEFHLDFAESQAPAFDPMLVGMQHRDVPTVVVAVSDVPTSELGLVAGALVTVFPTVETLAFVAEAFMEVCDDPTSLADYDYGSLRRRFNEGDANIRPVLISSVVGPWPAPVVGMRVLDEDGHWQPYPVDSDADWSPSGIVRTLTAVLRHAPTARADFAATFPMVTLGDAQLEFLRMVARTGANVIALSEDIPWSRAPFN